MKNKHTIYIGSGYVWAVDQKTGIHDWGFDIPNIDSKEIEQQIKLFHKKYPKARVLELEPGRLEWLMNRCVKLTIENKKLKKQLKIK